MGFVLQDSWPPAAELKTSELTHSVSTSMFKRGNHIHLITLHKFNLLNTKGHSFSKQNVRNQCTILARTNWISYYIKQAYSVSESYQHTDVCETFTDRKQCAHILRTCDEIQDSRHSSFRDETYIKLWHSPFHTSTQMTVLKCWMKLFCSSFNVPGGKQKIMTGWLLLSPM